MMAPVIGTLILLAALGAVGLGLLTMVVAGVRGQAPLFRIGAVLTGAAVTGYGLLWVLGFLLAPSHLVPAGDEVHFCGVDCHLHVSAVKVARGADIAVTLRFRSDARGAPEYPGLLRLTAVDSRGRRYAPSAGMMAEPLAAGQSIEREFRFSVPGDAGPARLEVSYDSVMDFLVPGLGNPLAQRRTPLALGAGS